MSRLVNRPAAAPRLPLPAKERLIALDVLRGLALLGVLLANITEIVSYGVVATASQLEGLITAPIDRVVEQLVALFITDKARTVLSILFGAGFIVLYSKWRAQGRPARALYVWRMAVLFLIGFCHLVFLWSWDILAVYAAAGLSLILVAEWSARRLLAVAAAVYCLIQVDWTSPFSEVERFSDITPLEVDFDRPVLALQAMSEQGDYFGLVSAFWSDTAYGFSSGSYMFGVLAAIPYMMTGAALVKLGWMIHPLQHRRKIGLWALCLLPIGLFLEAMSYDHLVYALPEEVVWAIWQIPFMDYCWFISAEVMALGYLFATLWWVAGFKASGGMGGVLTAFGRMALTNYVMQSVLIGLLLFGVGPGLNLAGKIGPGYLLSCGILIFWGQALFSVYWLRTFEVGPLEYVWRRMSGGRPRLLRGIGGPSSVEARV